MYEYYYENENGSGSMKYRSFNVPFLFKWNGFYYALLSDYTDTAQGKYAEKVIKNLDVLETYQGLIKGN